jgi:hypothetical protein
MERVDDELLVERRGEDGLDTRPTTDLVRELFENAQVLFKEEIALAKVEARREAKKAAAAGASIGVGGAVLYAGVLVFAAFLVIGGAYLMPLWLSALIVAVLFLAIGGGMAAAGAKKLKSMDPKATDTAKTLKEDKEWAKSTMQSVRSHRRVHA